MASLLKHKRQNKSEMVNAINTDLRGFFEAKEDTLSSSALFLSLIVAVEGKTETVEAAAAG